MEKNWLIRTRARQILGPVGKQKVLEFVEKGSLTGDDEISSGNGYWFCIKEKELLDKYIYGDLPQGFNPITEAPNVLTSNLNTENEMTGSLNPNTMPKEKPPAPVEEPAQDDPINVPDGQDLDYPDMGASSDKPVQVPDSDDLAFPESTALDYPDMGAGTIEDITMVGSLPTLETASPKVEAPVIDKPSSAPSIGHVEDQVPSTNEEGILPEGDDLDYPDMGVCAAPVDDDQTDPSIEIPTPGTEDITKDDIVFSEVPEASSEVTPDLPDEIDETVKKKSKKKVKGTKTKKKSQRNDRYLLYVLVCLILIILYGAFYYFTNVINSEASISNIFIDKVYAQSTIGQIAKKKTLLN